MFTNDFMSLLAISCYTECADGRDRVYGILSLVGSEQRRMLDITPNYSREASALAFLLIDKIGRYYTEHDRYRLWGQKNFVKIISDALEVKDSEPRARMERLRTSQMIAHYIQREESYMRHHPPIP
jgi:hypothetical protein